MARPVALTIVPLVAEAFRRPRWTDARADKPNRIGVDVAIDRVARGIADAAGGGQSGRVEGGRGGKLGRATFAHLFEIGFVRIFEDGADRWANFCKWLNAAVPTTLPIRLLNPREPIFERRR